MIKVVSITYYFIAILLAELKITAYRNAENDSTLDNRYSVWDLYRNNFAAEHSLCPAPHICTRCQGAEHRIGSELTVGPTDKHGTAEPDYHRRPGAERPIGKELLKIGRLSASSRYCRCSAERYPSVTLQLSVSMPIWKDLLPRQAPTSNSCSMLSLPRHRQRTIWTCASTHSLIRRGKVSYDVLSAKSTPGKFNPQHIRLSTFLPTSRWKHSQNDSVNAAIKRMSVEEEHSGFELKKLKSEDNSQRPEDADRELRHRFTNTSLAMDTIRMEYDNLESLGHFTDDVRFSFRMRCLRK